MDRYVSHFLDARFFWFGRPSGHHVLVYLGGKIMIIGCIFKCQYPIREAKFQTRSGEIVSKLRGNQKKWTPA